MAKKRPLAPVPADPYSLLLTGISDLLDQARRAVARSVNTILTATYWDVGRRIVEFEQGGRGRAAYGEELLRRLAADHSKRFGRGFSRQGLQRMRAFYAGWEICSTPLSKLQARVRDVEPGGTPGLQPATPAVAFHADLFPLPWSHYVRLLSVPDARARAFYEAEAIRDGWSVRHPGRQIATPISKRLTNRKGKAVTAGVCSAIHLRWSASLARGILEVWRVTFSPLRRT
jgi:hypothetical protein